MVISKRNIQKVSIVFDIVFCVMKLDSQNDHCLFHFPSYLLYGRLTIIIALHSCNCHTCFIFLQKRSWAGIYRSLMNWCLWVESCNVCALIFGYSSWVLHDLQLTSHAHIRAYNITFRKSSTSYGTDFPCESQYCFILSQLPANCSCSQLLLSD